MLPSPGVPSGRGSVGWKLCLNSENAVRKWGVKEPTFPFLTHINLARMFLRYVTKTFTCANEQSQ